MFSVIITVILPRYVSYHYQNPSRCCFHFFSWGNHSWTPLCSSRSSSSVAVCWTVAFNAYWTMTLISHNISQPWQCTWEIMLCKIYAIRIIDSYIYMHIHRQAIESVRKQCCFISLVTQRSLTESTECVSYVKGIPEETNTHIE